MQYASAGGACGTNMGEFFIYFFISGDWVESPFCERTGIDNDFKMGDASCGWWNPVNVFCVSCCLPLSVSENRSYRYQGMSERRAIAKRSPSSQDSSITGFIRYEHLVAGISGGVTSTLILHPLDLIKIRFQGKMISHNNWKQYDDPESEFLTIIPETCQKGGKKSCTESAVIGLLLLVIHGWNPGWDVLSNHEA